MTIAIPCFNEERHIEACLADIFAQDYPPASIEVLIGDGMSTDGTREIIGRIVSQWPGAPRVRVIDNPRRLQAAAMNAVIAEARGEIIIRMDVHARYATDYVRQCIAVLEATGAANVGGAQRARPKTWFQRALCAALDSPVAVGGARYRNADAEGFVDTVFLGAFRKRVFEAAGGYDPMAITNEDAELNQRILAGGGKIYLSKKIVVHYYPRDSFRSLSRQYFRYGQGRARTLLKHKTFPTPRPAIPFLMVTAGGALLLKPSWRRRAPLAFGAYGALVAVEALRVSRRHGWTLAPAVAAIFPVLHLSHGVGFGVGLVQYALKPDWAAHAVAAGGGGRT
ncbi:Succinoglycan biosynthesis protein exoA [Labilithrix luteola]|uniref:Succinoglycan biosynthesis protein exoA n=1 Tax=Labilithrix luteola TaxID=1391654 RepID=A0A0K1PY63_9BACT|nr:Succinoglycan biosynthesis protein exoA [Labilithrix luteola]